MPVENEYYDSFIMNILAKINKFNQRTNQLETMLLKVLEMQENNCEGDSLITMNCNKIIGNNVRISDLVNYWDRTKKSRLIVNGKKSKNKHNV